MANETEVIRDKMEETRNDLSDKLEQLEKQVVDTVQGATSAVTDTVQQATSAVTDAVQSARDVVDTVKDSVQDTVDSVKESMDDTVESVKQTFDLPRQVDRHPWLMVGGAVAMGFVAGKLLNYAPAAARAAPNVARTMSESLRPTVGRFAEAAASTASTVGSAAAAASGLMSTLESMFGPEINKVKELALGALFGMVRDMAVQAAPETMAPQVREIIDGFTTKLGGKPVEGPVLGPRPTEEEVHNGPGRRF